MQAALPALEVSATFSADSAEVLLAEREVLAEQVALLVSSVEQVVLAAMRPLQALELVPQPPL